MTGDPRRSSISLLEEIVSKDPSTALYLPLAERLREEGRVEEALRLCEERRDRPGAGVGDRVVLGRCYLAGGQLSAAREAFEQALILDRENVAALKALAGILAHQGEHGRAADLYRAVCRVDPGDLESQTALHQITSGEYPEARLPEIVIGQGDVAWEPIRLPREEEHLSELSLGLRTIEVFEMGGAASGALASGPMPYDAGLPLEPPNAGIPAGLRAGAAEVGTEPAGPAPVRAMPARPGAEAARTRRAPVEKSLDQNRSAFQDWISRMKPGSDR